MDALKEYVHVGTARARVIQNTVTPANLRYYREDIERHLRYHQYHHSHNGMLNSLYFDRQQFGNNNVNANTNINIIVNQHQQQQQHQHYHK